MVKILANDGIDASGKHALEQAGFYVETSKIPQDALASGIQSGGYEVVLVRSATKITADIIDACPQLRMLGRAGVGMDNIDIKHAESKGIKVFNTPAASSQSVAELVMAHLFSGVRFLQDSNHQMRIDGTKAFNDLKKRYSTGTELQGKTLGIIGFGRIGQAVARMAIGMGMKVVASDPFLKDVVLKIQIAQTNQSIEIPIQTVAMDELLKQSDFVTLHVPGKINGKAVLGKDELALMKQGAGLVNAARGGVIDEDALLEALNSKHLAFAGLDVFENEPSPRADLLVHPGISISPHIGASTAEAQERIAAELAQTIIAYYATAQ
ncbi:MAG: D-2-hydroxyacid dehydrogenase [Bacteroidia bacterium]|jgi:D-3-phosphoglycerate dehydrogenase